MALKIVERIMEIADAPPRYYQQKWLRTVESLMVDLKNDPGTTFRVVEPMLAQRYEGDFYGLLISMGISAKFHWIIMRVNDMNSSTDFNGLGFTMIYPSIEFIEENMTLFRTIYKNVL